MLLKGIIPKFTIIDKQRARTENNALLYFRDGRDENSDELVWDYLKSNNIEPAVLPTIKNSYSVSDDIYYVSDEQMFYLKLILE